MTKTQEIIEQNGGIENFRCFAQMRKLDVLAIFGFGLVSDDNTTWVECKITEDRYKVEDDYKITLTPLNPLFTSRSYYTNSFCKYIEEGWILIKTEDNSKVSHISWVEPIYGGAVLIHEADVVVPKEV